MLGEEETVALLRRAKTGDNEAKELLLTHNVSLLKSILRRYLGKGVEYDDLFQLASLGFLKAIAGFDESFGVRFSTYAVPMIAGEIKRFLRDDGSVKVSRAMKKTARDLNRYIENYAMAHGNQPTVKELAEAFSMEEADVVFTLGSSRMPVSIYEQTDFKDEKAATLAEKLPAKDGQEEMLDRMVLKEAIEKPLFPRHDAERSGEGDRGEPGADLSDRKQDHGAVQERIERLILGHGMPEKRESSKNIGGIKARGIQTHIVRILL